jgi:hypothetical protein
MKKGTAALLEMPPCAHKLVIIYHSSPNQQHLQYQTNQQGTINNNNEA